MYTYDSFTMLYSRNWHNIVKWLYSQLKKKESGTHNQCWRSLEDTEEDICIGQLIRFPGWSRWISVYASFSSTRNKCITFIIKSYMVLHDQAKGESFHVRTSDWVKTKQQSGWSWGCQVEPETWQFSTELGLDPACQRTKEWHILLVPSSVHSHQG